MSIDNANSNSLFQHTAARRRLAAAGYGSPVFGEVSTHSRPKAAGGLQLYNRALGYGFNTQPPEGGWMVSMLPKKLFTVSTHSRPKAAGLVMP